MRFLKNLLKVAFVLTCMSVVIFVFGLVLGCGLSHGHEWLGFVAFIVGVMFVTLIYTYEDKIWKFLNS